MKSVSFLKAIAFFSACILFSCNENTGSKSTHGTLDLKRGEIITCGPQEGELFGTVSFTATIPKSSQADFNTAIALLHSFEYDEAEKMFAKVIDKCPDCAMAYWGVAMSNFHPLWAPPTPEELKKGKQAVDIAASIKDKTSKEAEYINAIGKFYENAEQLDHRSRVLNFESAMAKIYSDHPDDKEAAIFYSLALNAAADPTDKTYSKQKKAIGILNEIFKEQPLHPGIAHYIIHNSDYPALAEMALPAARKYASIAPASAHAQHMPSHIFTRLGLWDECIQSNLVSVSSAKCYAEQSKINGHWDEELHALDYLVYAYLQKGADKKAEEQLNYLRTINKVQPSNFKTYYAFASIPSRYYLEKRMWKEAATMELYPLDQGWDKFPWQKAIFHFARSLGYINTNNIAGARTELDSLNLAYENLSKQKNKAIEAAQVAVQVKTVNAWIGFKEGNKDNALRLMKEAADREDGTEKHPVTPGEVYPARELLAEMLLQMNKPAEALVAFETDLVSRPKRFNALYGAGLAAERSGDKEKARNYFNELLQITEPGSERKEIAAIRSYASRQ
jgi:tetratricopeptide (TPR) repeat protein